MFENDETSRSLKAEAEHIRLAINNEYFQCDTLLLLFDVTKNDYFVAV